MAFVHFILIEYGCAYRVRLELEFGLSEALRGFSGIKRHFLPGYLIAVRKKKIPTQNKCSLIYEITEMPEILAIREPMRNVSSAAAFKKCRSKLPVNKSLRKSANSIRKNA